jgi:release factor glutamine methyltransferase
VVKARELLDETRKSLAALEPDAERSPREADWLFRAVTGLDIRAVLARPDELISAETVDRLRDLVQRRATGEPLQYLIGDVEFWGRDFVTDHRALIPRQETETLVESALEVIPKDEPRDVAELGTGSGVVAITLALERPLARLVATDISGDALRLATENAQAWGAGERIRMLEGDLTEPLRDPVDVLVFNPPYIPSVAFGAIQRELAYEPRQALDGGADGLDTYRRLASSWRDVVRPGGWLFVEVGAGQHLAVTEILGADEPKLWDDYRGIVRVVGTTR